jgi:hypothetical protein
MNTSEERAFRNKIPPISQECNQLGPGSKDIGFPNVTDFTLSNISHILFGFGCSCEIYGMQGKKLTLSKKREGRNIHINHTD